MNGLSKQRIPRLVLAASASDSGKTTIALGMIAAFRRRGLEVAAAKVGPDFIDAAHLARASGRPARNLDAWLCPERAVVQSFARGCGGANLAVIEGAMGLFDGRHGTGEGSTAHVARTLEAPVILLLDCARASSTIGAVAYGLARYDRRLRIAGAVLNRVASERHAATVRDAVIGAAVPVLGAVPRDERLEIPRRHLGLVEPDGEEWRSAVEAAADAVEKHVDLDRILEAAAATPEVAVESRGCETSADVRVGIARDEAFWFYDEASLDALRDRGAELVPFSPLRDPFPNVDAALVGGGYPELHAASLEANVDARRGLRAAIEAGMSVYAECGGLMYLGSTLETPEGTHEMVGAVPAASAMSPRRSKLRYVEARSLGDGPMFARDSVVRGHEFHYSKTRYEKTSPAFQIEDECEGYVSRNVHASYVHVHLGMHPNAVGTFLRAARAFGGRS